MNVLSVDEIMNIEGIVVRKLPKVVTSNYLVRDNYKLSKGDIESGAVLHTKNGRLVMTVIKETENPGFLVTIVKSTGSIVHFNIDKNGFGETIPDAYNNYINKGK